MTAPHERWPDTLWLVRHGESAGNVARDRAYAANAPMIDIAERDLDVPLSETGAVQGAALGRWFAQMPDGERPNVVLASPYLRARDTVDLIQREGGLASGALVRLDECLREKEFGMLDRLTRLGIEQRFPEQAAMRERLGKFYYRPPQGESWSDVILRLRNSTARVNMEFGEPGYRVLVVAHQVVVLCLRYIIERLTEQEILDIDRAGEVANCGVTTYRRDDSTFNGALRLQTYNFVAPIQQQGAPVTSTPDVPGGAK